MRCFLKPRDNKGLQLYSYLKLRRFSLSPLRDMDLFSIAAYNEIYHTVKAWLYVTDSVLQEHGCMIYWVTLHSLSDESYHMHAHIEVKYRPTIEGGVVYRQTMGSHTTIAQCVHFGRMVVTYNRSV